MNHIGYQSPALPPDKANEQGEKLEVKNGRRAFKQKVAELKTELDKLPADRQEQLRWELDDERPEREGK